MKKYILLILFAVALTACSNKKDGANANGNFEAQEIIISSEIAGKIIEMNAEEGTALKAGDMIAVIDSTGYVLSISQAKAQKQAIETKIPSVLAQINVLDEQNQTLIIEKNRTLQMLKGKAATQQMLDNIEGKIKVNDAQIKQVKTQNASVLSELGVLKTQVDQLRDKINRCKIVCPINAVVLNKYSEKYEIAAPGKPMVKIADISTMKLRVYVTADWLDKIKIGDMCNVRIDKGSKDFYNYEGKISKIAQSAEFTPKTIETKEERVNYVYAVEITVKNDGKIKIGMPGEVIFK
jgi:HlyD family secretion protein